MPNPEFDDIYEAAGGETDHCGMHEFIQAENYGKTLGGCWAKYSSCRVPMRKIVYNALFSLSQNNHLLYHDEL